jgi:hypothetical protein
VTEQYAPKRAPSQAGQMRRINRLLNRVRAGGIDARVHETVPHLRGVLGRYHVDVITCPGESPRVVPDVVLDALEVWASAAARAVLLGQPLPAAPWPSS